MSLLVLLQELVNVLESLRGDLNRVVSCALGGGCLLLNGLASAHTCFHLRVIFHSVFHLVYAFLLSVESLNAD